MTTSCDEAARLEALHQYRILDTDPDDRFDAITRLAANICDTPMALVTLVDERRQWFESSVGVDVAETSRDVSFCAHAISQPEVFIVADALADERFAANPLVTGAPHIRFYAGAPLINADGYALGTLCVLDRRPRQLSSEQFATLCVLSDVVVSQLELRRNNLALEEARDKFKLILNATAEGICGVDTEGRASFVNHAAARMLGWKPHELLGKMMHQLVHHSYADGSAYSMDQCPVYAACRDGIAHEVHGEVFWRRDGSYFPVEYSSTPIYRDGSIEGAVVVFEDIAARVRSEDALRTHEARTSAMLATALDCVVAMDHMGRIIEFNPAAEATFGYTRASLLGEDLADKIIPPAMRAAHRKGMAHYLATDEGPVLGKRIEIEALRADGTVFPVELAIARTPVTGQPEFTAYLRDITARRQTEKALRHNEERYRSLVTATASIVWSADPDGSLAGENHSWQAFTGQTPEEYKRWGWLKAVHPEDRERGKLAWRQSLKNHTTFEIEKRLRHRDGHYRHMLVRAVPVFDADRRLREWIGQCTDITERKQAEARISYLANYDGLTGLPNRLLLTDRLGQALMLARRRERPVAVCALGIDHFKNVNDTLGHEVGDFLLQQIAKRLTDCVRASDTVARLSGDEFAVMLTDIERRADVSRVTEKMLMRVAEPVVAPSQALSITASIGVALYPKNGEDARTLLKHADAAMHLAKERGRNQYRHYSRAVGNRAAQRLSLESDLRRALARKEFLLHYQPIVDLASGRIIVIEALLRWQRSGAEALVPPGEFIPVLEQSNLITAVGDWVLHAACEQMRAWRQQGVAVRRVAVNISARQFYQMNMKKTVERILNETGLDPDGLELELTESMLQTKGVESALHALRRLGVRIAIDDFGTGYSSLSYLKRFSIDSLKIDRSFVQGTPADADNAAIATAIVSMAHSLSLEVIAEGVETVAQLNFLRAIGCDAAQGFLLSRPLPAAELAGLLHDRQDFFINLASTATPDSGK